ncbi:helix-turn-helix domain-containing protein [Micromonospora zhanjiangensis]|uniref:Helix-turn-helix domain-containing protein n=1 Tax=Micromonospora zhanjiangensis TaxID=1522057 RepID=A0ABV8KQB3_9ACTN
MGADFLPIGRRVAHLRTRRKLSQQMFADRLGKSKSWVDKVERGVRALDRVSTLQEIATVLRIDATALLEQDDAPVDVVERDEGVERIRAALSRYEIPLGRSSPQRPALSIDQVNRTTAHAWTAFQHARYPQVVNLLPDLLVDVERTRAHQPGPGQVPLVDAYRVAAAVLVKLGAPGPAWLAVDRAMNVAANDGVLVASAAVQLGQVLRTSGWAREAKSVTLAAAYRIIPPVIECGLPEQLSLCGALLVQAALAAAHDGDGAAAAELLDEAAGMAERVGDGKDHHRTGFGPTAVELARTASAVELGDSGGAVARHETNIQRDGWRWLPAEHRAAYLIDAARAYLHSDDPINAARLLVDADRLAPAEVRQRPAARAMLADIARAPGAPATIIRLATVLRVRDRQSHPGQHPAR